MTTRAAKSRYGINEWFGQDVTRLKKSQRAAYLALATDKATMQVACPFASSIARDATCSKPGGVCTIRKYEQHANGVLASAETPVTVCPQRFLQDAALLRWAGSVMLGTSRPIIVEAIPFLAKISNSATEGNSDKVGPFDWVLIHQNNRSGLRWCAVGAHAVHFPEHAGTSEFQSWANAMAGVIPFPSVLRRPNYRSSGSKRLAPHLQENVPKLRKWGAQTAVIIDEHFFAQMSHVRALSGKTEDQLANADVVWLVARYKQGKLIPGDVVYARLDDSIRALMAPRAVTQSTFEGLIRRALADPTQLGKSVFQL